MIQSVMVITLENLQMWLLLLKVTRKPAVQDNNAKCKNVILLTNTGGRNLATVKIFITSHSNIRCFNNNNNIQ